MQQPIRPNDLDAESSPSYPRNTFFHPPPNGPTLRQRPHRFNSLERQPAALRRRIALAFIIAVWTSLGCRCSGFNLDPASAVDIRRSGLGEGSQFGLALAFHVDRTSTSLLVGAPRANDTNSPSLVEPGVFFACALSPSGGSDGTCLQLGIDQGDDQDTADHFVQRSRRLLGMTLDSLASVNGSTPLSVVCAPKWTKSNRVSNEIDASYSFPLGACYQYRNAVLSPSWTLVTNVSYPCHSRQTSKLEYAQIGMSAHITMNGQLMMGIPGYFYARGGVLMRQESRECVLFADFSSESDYLGYSVSSAVASSSAGNQIYVSGAPRRNNKGEVWVFSVSACSMNGLQVLNLMSEVARFKSAPLIGSYYGASLCVVDVNADGWEDLIVGAPGFNQSKGDEGAAFLYLRISEKRFAETYSAMLLGGRNNGSRFGTAMASMDDVNLDGFNDVVVGAPYDDEGRGAVYLYLGGAKDIFAGGFAQKFRSLHHSGFGYSLTPRAADVDGNAYPDLAVGAYKSNTAVLVRTRPVHSLIAEITYSTAAVTWPLPTCASGRHQAMMSFDVNVTFHYNQPIREMARGAIMGTQSGWFLDKSGSTGASGASLAFTRNQADSLPLSVRRCLAVRLANTSRDCVSLESTNRNGWFIGEVDNRIQMLERNTASDRSFAEKVSFLVWTNLWLNGTTAFESLTNRGQFLSVDNQGHLALIPANQQELSSENSSFILTAESIWSFLKGINYTLTAKSQLSNVRLDLGKVTHVTGSVDFTAADVRRPKTLKYRASFTDVPINVLFPPLEPISFELRIDQPESNVTSRIGQSLPPILEALAPHNFTRQLAFDDACGDDHICRPDVRVRIESGDSAVVVGRRLGTSISVILHNAGEPANRVQVSLRYPACLKYRQAQTDCPGARVSCMVTGNADRCNAEYIADERAPEYMNDLLCELENPLYANVTITVQVNFGSINETFRPRGQPVQFTANVTALTANASLTGRPEVIRLPVQYDGRLAIQQDRTSESAFYDPNNPTFVTMVHSYKVDSYGTGLLPNVTIIVYTPTCDDVSADLLKKRTIYVSEGSHPGREIAGTDLSPDSIAFLDSTAIPTGAIFFTSDHQAPEPGMLSSNNTREKKLVTNLACRPLNDFRRARRFDVGSMQPGDSVSVRIDLIVDPRAFLHQSNLVHLAVETRIVAFPGNSSHAFGSSFDIDEPKIDKHIITSLKPSKEREGLAFWIVALIGVGIGLVLLTIGVIILKKCGFFERRLHDEARARQKLLNHEDQMSTTAAAGKDTGLDEGNGSLDGDRSVADESKRSNYDIPGAENYKESDAY